MKIKKDKEKNISVNMNDKTDDNIEELKNNEIENYKLSKQDLIKLLSNSIQEQYYSKENNFYKEYSPNNSNQYGNKFIDLNLGNCKFSAGSYDLDEFILTSSFNNFLKTDSKENDSKVVYGMREKADTVKGKTVATNGTEKSAVAVFMEKSKSAKNMIESLKKIVESGETSPKGIESLNELLPFLNIKDDINEKNDLNIKINNLKSLIHNTKDINEKEKLKENLFITEKKVHIINMIINKKLQKKQDLIHKLNNAISNKNKNENSDSFDPNDLFTIDFEDILNDVNDSDLLNENINEEKNNLETDEFDVIENEENDDDYIVNQIKNFMESVIENEDEWESFKNLSYNLKS